MKVKGIVKRVTAYLFSWRHCFGGYIDGYGVDSLKDVEMT